ncbi:hypothetical protein CW304_30075 [Bacillus sp. UFRGS-B20]|nr:hypothetical protein CW304_30075 [Bacillus sp. UFRGS-B20]
MYISPYFHYVKQDLSTWYWLSMPWLTAVAYIVVETKVNTVVVIKLSGTRKVQPMVVFIKPSSLKEGSLDQGGHNHSYGYHN